MTESLSVSVKSRSGGKIYLDGTACGNTGNYYCIAYGTIGASGDISNNSQSYTYWGGGCLGIGASGCYIPDHGDGVYRIYLDEVTVYGCEDILRYVDAKTLIVESEPETVIINILVKDQHDTKIAGAQVTIPTAQGAKTISTNYQGVAVGFTLEKNTFHTADITYLPPDWEKTGDSNRTFVPTGSSTYVLYVNKKAEYYDIDFYVCDQAIYHISGALCIVGGKTATTNVNGMCSITLLGGKSYTATCSAPSGYTCSCGGCKCSDGPFTLTGNRSITFVLDEVTIPIEYCQQDFKVLDQYGKPVEYVIVGCEDRTDYTNFDVLGHAGTGTSRDGTVATLKTIKGRSYNFYISQFPAGYDVDVDGVSLIRDVVACAPEVIFRIKDLSTVPDPCSVNVCVQDQDGNNVPGVAIYIKYIGTVSTKSDISMFGCTGKIGLTCGDSITVTETVPSGYEGVKTTETFTASGDKTIILTIRKSDNGVICTGKTKAECDATTGCYWWDSDNSCHDTPESTAYPTLNITSDIDVVGGIDVYVDGTKRGTTPFTVSFDESYIEKTTKLSGEFADIMRTKDKYVVLKAGTNDAKLELIMDNKEILAGGALATILLVNFM